MTRLAFVIATLSIVTTLAGCAAITDESPAASPDLSEGQTVPQRAQQAP